MAMPEQQYWNNRFEQLDRGQQSSSGKVFRNVETSFRKAQQDIQKDIDAWIARVAKNNAVTFTEASKMLNARELDEFKWTVEQYIKHGEENAIDGRWQKQLENASARFHVSRLDAIKLQMQQHSEVAFGGYLDSVDEGARKWYTDGYYKSAYEIQKGVGVGWDVAKIDTKRLDKVIKEPYAADGRNFSSRIWGAKTEMVSNLQAELTRMVGLGESPERAINHMTQFVDGKVKNAKNAAGRLIMTENAFFASAGQKDAFTALGVDQYEYVATLDSVTSEVCQSMDGHVFPMSKFEIGVTAPPLHPWCRSVTAPHFDDEWAQSGERAARGADGKTYYVPSAMKYPEWKKSFVDGGDKSDLQSVLQGDIIKSSIASGAIKLAVNIEKQNRHIKGTNEYVEGKSYLDVDVSQIQDIVGTKHGTGELIVDRHGNWRNKERIECDKYIGYNISIVDGLETITKLATIHYSKTGTHLVPRMEE